MVSYRNYLRKKISFNTTKNCKKDEIVYVNNVKLQLLFKTISTFTNNHIFSMIIQNRTIIVSLWHAHKGKQPKKHTKSQYHE